MRRCIVCLQELDLFRGLDTPEFMRVCQCTARKRLLKGDILFHQGDTVDTVYLLKKGKLKLTQSNENGREVILDICGPGEILGELSFFHAQPAFATAIAMEEVYLCSFSYGQFQSLICADSAFALRIISYLGEKRYETLRKQGEETGQTVREKLLRLFYRFAEEYGTAEEDGVLIALKITQQELADCIGSSRVMVVHALKELETADLIGRRGKYYILKPDPCTSVHIFE